MNEFIYSIRILYIQGIDLAQDDVDCKDYLIEGQEVCIDMYNLLLIFHTNY